MFEDMTLEELECLNVRHSLRLTRANVTGDWMVADIIEGNVLAIRREILTRRQQAAEVKADPQP
jgi:hypothetical protein